jgi:DNA gyrase subunit A
LGLINIKTTERNGKVVALKTVHDDDELMLITANGMMIRTGLEQVREIGRNTAGVRMITLKEGDKLVAAARLASENGQESESESESEGSEQASEDE